MTTSRCLRSFCLVALGVFALTGMAHANVSPGAPVITEPSFDGKIANAADVHMEATSFSDPDPGDTHFCTDWEIWSVVPSARVWASPCETGVEKVHTHLGDGAFEGALAGHLELDPDTDYRLRARFSDSSGDAGTRYGPYAERFFTTGPPSVVFPLELVDVAPAPAPRWTDATSTDIVLPAGASQPFLRLESAAGELLLEIAGFDGFTNQVANPGTLAAHVPVRVHVDAGSIGAPLILPESELAFTDASGTDHLIYLPALDVTAGTPAYFWVAANGGTYQASIGQATPDFSVLARGAAVPWNVRKPGYKVEVFATGLQLPVNVAFVPSPGPGADDPFFYVTELYGQIKVVTRGGIVGDYATGLLNYNPTGAFPGSGEQGLTGLAVDPVSGDVFASMLYSTNPANDGAAHYPKVVRLHSTDGGLTAATITTILDLVGETQGQSHQISNLSIGPDGLLYVHVGDGFDANTAQNRHSFRGKILRVNLDGTPVATNPFYTTVGGIDAEDFIFAYGFRNPFGGAWRALDGSHYEVENGPSVDRFAKVVAGRNYLWNGSDASMANFALYNWNPATAPVNIAFVQSTTFGGSGFPASVLDHAFVTESGGTWATGPQANAKRITEFVLTAAGDLTSGPTPLVEYDGSGKASVAGLAAGPDGLYFTDLYKDVGYLTPIDRGANVLRVKFVGSVDFDADVRFADAAPHTVHFTSLATVPNPTSWLWTFGDGTTSTLPNPTHTYTADGSYDVRLVVTGANGAVVAQKNAFIGVGLGAGDGLLGEYFDNMDFTASAFSRLDPRVDFQWGNGSPAPQIGPDTFSVRWTGFVAPLYSETYTLRTTSDDGVRLTVNGQVVIDNFTDHAPTTNSGQIALVAGTQYPVLLEFYENGGGAEISLEWQSASQPREVIPSAQLSPPATSGEAVAWEIGVSRGDRGLATLLLGANGALSGYGIRSKCPELFAIGGTWTETDGVVTGSYVESCDGVDTPGTFEGKIKAGKSLSLKATAGALTYGWRGRPRGALPDLVGGWSGTASEGTAKQSETWTLTSTPSVPGSFDLAGNGVEAISGQVLVTSKRKAAAIRVRPGLGATVLFGRSNRADSRLTFSGKAGNGTRVRVKTTRP